MKVKKIQGHVSLLAVISVVVFETWIASTAKAELKLGSFINPNVGAPKIRVCGGVRGGLILPKSGAPKTRVGSGVRGVLTLLQVGVSKTRIGGGMVGGLQLPQVDATKIGVGGGVSGVSEEDTDHHITMPVVFVLTPESTGYTVSESPTLYYYVTDDTSFEFEITINRDERTLVQLRRREKTKAGLHGISLGDLGISGWRKGSTTNGTWR